jgi:early secretory antigenic target protein ESAT-6
MMARIGRYTALGMALVALSLVSVGCGGGGSSGDAHPTPTSTLQPPTNSQMTTETAALLQAASEFDSISSELLAALSRVEDAASELLVPSVDNALQAAFTRFQDARIKQRQDLSAISDDITAAGITMPGEPDAGGPVAQSPNGLIYNFDGGSSVAQIQAIANQIQPLLDQGQQVLIKLSSVWGGSGSEAYSTVQKRWDETGAELMDAIQNLSDKILQAYPEATPTPGGLP